MGAFDTPKLVICCGDPSSNSRKFSFLRPGTHWPFFKVTITSTFTRGTFTLME